MDANTRLKELETALREDGVVDVKFFFDHNRSSLSTVVSDVVTVLDAVVSKRYDVAPAFNDAVHV